MIHTSAHRLASEFFGTALLVATVVGSGIMAETLSGGNVAIALLANTIAKGADHRASAVNVSIASGFFAG